MRKKAEKIERSCGAFSIDDRAFDAGEIPDHPPQDNKHPTPEQLLVREAVRWLTPRQRAVWELYNYDKLTQDEIAKKLDISQPVVAKHIKAIERRVAKWVKGNMGAYKLLKGDLG